MAVCGLGSAGGVSTAGFFPRHWSLPTSLHSFPKGCHLCPQQPGHTEVPGILPAHGRAQSTRHLHTGVSSSSRGPCAHPAASQLPGKLILHWKISVHLPPSPPISGMYHFQQNCCQEKFLRLEFFVHVWKSHLGGTISQHLGQGNGGTSDGLFQMQISDLNFPYV